MVKSLIKIIVPGMLNQDIYFNIFCHFKLFSLIRLETVSKTFQQQIVKYIRQKYDKILSIMYTMHNFAYVMDKYCFRKLVLINVEIDTDIAMRVEQCEYLNLRVCYVNGDDLEIVKRCNRVHIVGCHNFELVKYETFQKNCDRRYLNCTYDGYYQYLDDVDHRHRMNRART